MRQNNKIEHSFAFVKTKRALAAVVCLGALVGCQDSSLDLAARADRKIVVGREIPLSIVSLEGLPDALAPRFSAALASEAQAREMAFVDSTAGPRFRLRGYFNAYPAENGTALSYVWDVYDASLKRARRVAGVEAVRGSNADPWQAIDEAALRRAAARSLDGVGEFLIARPAETAPVASRPADAAAIRASAD